MYRMLDIVAQAVICHVCDPIKAASISRHLAFVFRSGNSEEAVG
jgi:hypothetical protein